MTGTVKNSFNAVKESLGFGDTPENLANQASDTPVQPTTPTPTQIGTGKVIVPGTNTEVPIDAVHAEIARRAAAKGIK